MIAERLSVAEVRHRWEWHVSDPSAIHEIFRERNREASENGNTEIGLPSTIRPTQLEVPSDPGAPNKGVLSLASFLLHLARTEGKRTANGVEVLLPVC